jgi:hypothetical protein
LETTQEDVAREAEEAARELMYQFGSTMSGEKLLTVLTLAWLEGSRRELVAIAKTL